MSRANVHLSYNPSKEEIALPRASTASRCLLAKCSKLFFENSCNYWDCCFSSSLLFAAFNGERGSSQNPLLPLPLPLQVLDRAGEEVHLPLQVRDDLVAVVVPGEALLPIRHLVEEGVVPRVAHRRVGGIVGGLVGLAMLLAEETILLPGLRAHRAPAAPATEVSLLRQALTPRVLPPGPQLAPPMALVLGRHAADDDDGAKKR